MRRCGQWSCDHARFTGYTLDGGYAEEVVAGRDGEEFVRVLARQPVETTIEVFPLAAADDALDRLRRGDIRGAAVLVMRRP